MKINVFELKKELNKLNLIIKRYEDSLLNIDYILEHSSDYWTDGHSQYFYDDLYSQKKNTSELIDNLKYISNMYNHIQRNYSKIGNQIDIDLNSQNELLMSLDDLIHKANILSSSYNNINPFLSPREASYINEQKYTAINVESKLNNIKRNMVNNINLIQRTEKDIFSMCFKYTIVEIKKNSNDYFNSSVSNISKAYIGKEELKNVVEKTKIYIKEQQTMIFDFKEIFENLQKCYMSNNSKTIRILCEKIISSIENVINNYVYDNNVLEKVITVHETVTNQYLSGIKEMGNFDFTSNNKKGDDLL